MGTDFTDLSPEIGQVFFIGDGRTSGGTLQNFHAPTGATRLYLGYADALNFGFPSSTPGSYWDNSGALNVAVSLNTMQQQPDQDWYKFTLTAGQATTLAVAHDNLLQATDVNLELYNASGTRIAVGIKDAQNVNAYIADFVPSTTGMYFARVSGSSVGNYDLIVTRGADFNLNVTGRDQDISLTNTVLGGSGSASSSSTTGIKVAVVSTGNSSADYGLQAIVDQLNDDTYFNFTATLITPSQADTLQELQQYDAVVVGGTRYSSSEFSQYASALLSYVQAGGGLVTTGWAPYEAQYLSGQARTDFEAVVPVNVTGSGDNYYNNYYSLT